MELIFGTQVLTVPPGWHFMEHEHEGIEVVGVLEGSVTLEVGAHPWHAGVGEVLAIPPYLPHGWSAKDVACLCVLHVARFPRDLANRLLPGYQPRLLRLPEPKFVEYESLFKRLISINGHASPQQMRLLRAYLEAFLLVLLEADESNGSNGSNGQLDQDPTRVAMHEVAAYMHIHLDQRLAVAQIARQFLMSEVTLRRRFHQTFGVAPKQYLLELRLGEAQHLLANSQLSIQEVAQQLGFFDLAHFSATFRRRFGMPPSIWRTSAQT